jgi:hypothetical protein
MECIRAAGLLAVVLALVGCGGGDAGDGSDAANRGGDMRITAHAVDAIALDVPVTFALDISNAGTFRAENVTLFVGVEYLGHFPPSGAAHPMLPAYLSETFAIGAMRTDEFDLVFDAPGQWKITVSASYVGDKNPVDNEFVLIVDVADPNHALREAMEGVWEIAVTYDDAPAGPVVETWQVQLALDDDGVLTVVAPAFFAGVVVSVAADRSVHFVYEPVGTTGETVFDGTLNADGDEIIGTVSGTVDPAHTTFVMTKLVIGG